MKTKCFFFALCLVFTLSGFGKTQVLNAQTTTPTTMSVMENAVRDVSDYLNGNIPQRSSIVFLSITSEFPALSDIVLNELITNAVNDRVFTVVDRQRLNEIRTEQALQLSGEVSDETAVSIGNFLGASAIIIGEVYALSGQFRLTIRALDVETAKIQGQYNKIIGRERDILNMIGNDGVSTTVSPQTRPTDIVYKIGDIGPAGGIIFFDKGEFFDGWRYLEAAPRISEFSAQWGAAKKNVKGTQRFIGSGKSNTEIIVKFLSDRGETDKAAQLCAALNIEGYNDWFLPSRDELILIYQNLVRTGKVLSFEKSNYLSSTQNNRHVVIQQDFSNGFQGSIQKVTTGRVRAVRRF